ncbi:endonuclease [Luteimonas viscosa]|uniref:Endonuclease n=1 Tax=Luteimonas viscosa TaxID=1132694 RepID=A0A5D4XQ88_9GAMM|nr:DNA-formamidopyrimidine glycosylase family protein [Luteimonas viscosa]TYT25951.1 endonuclease [Luteimonas viscosa]
MPEGPSIVILREEAAKFRRQTVRKVSGNSSIDLERMQGRRVVSLRSWGKHFLVEFSGFSLRVHLLMFGTYHIDEPKPKPPRLALEFDNGTLYFYTASLKYVEGPLDDSYDWRADVMSPDWDPALARRKLRRQPDTLACDALLDQDVFAGVGNIIKNEVLFRIGVHPESPIGALPPRTLTRLVAQAREYSFDFLEWKKRYVLRQHWLVHRKRDCPTCGAKLAKAKLGMRERWAYFCVRCQQLY